MVSRNAAFHERGLVGAMLGPLKWVFAVGLVILGVNLMAWIVDGVCVFWLWPEGVGRLKQVLALDLARTSALADGQGGFGGWVVGMANGLYALLFQVTGIHAMGTRFASGEVLSIPDTVARNAYVANRQVIEVAMIGTQLVGVRCASVCLMLPLLGLGYVVAAADGLCQRAIRRACGGRESASVYHRAKVGQEVLLATGLLGVLLLPVSIDVRSIGMLVAIGLVILTRLQWNYYKKYV